MTRAYYNENDPYPAQWLRNLIAAGHIAPGDVDERSIKDVKPDDLKGYTQCHFFAGIGGWSYALRLAGWPDDRPVWTGSCPCQSLSTATHGRPTAEDLWPEFRRLIAANKPAILFGEQVQKSWWMERLCTDLDAMDYDIGAAVLPAYSIKKDHARHRVYFVAHSDMRSEHDSSINAETSILSRGICDCGKLCRSDGLSTNLDRRRTNKGFGNAIVPQVAAEFIKAADECLKLS